MKEEKIKLLCTKNDVHVVIEYSVLSREAKEFLEEDLSQELKHAIYVADYGHMGQFRHMGKDKGKNYIIHPIRICKSFDMHLNRIEKEKLQCASLLHDVVEDTDFTIVDITKAFGSEIASIVGLLSAIPGETYFDFIMRVIESKNKYAMLVKMADLRDNLAGNMHEKKAMLDKYRLALYVLEKEYQKICLS